MIMLDTDTCIEMLRGNRQVLNKCSQYDGMICVSFMTVGELFYGASNSSRPNANNSLVEEFLLTVETIESDFNIMKRFGETKSRLKGKNMMLPDADIIIASSVLEYCDMLVTGNTKHFNRIEHLRVENWIR